MMAGNPSSWWSMHPQQSSPLLTTSHPSSLLSSHQYVLGGGSSTSQRPLNSLADHHNQEVLPQSWSQLLLGGLPGDQEDRFFIPSHFQPKKLENWEEEEGLNQSSSRIKFFDVKEQEAPQTTNFFGHGNIGGEEFQTPNPAAAAAWSQQIMAVSSPRSCVTSLSSNILLDFSYTEADHHRNINNIQPPPDHSSSECNSTAANGGACKKARVQPSSSQPPLKVRKEKLGDRITALHQLVSPFGKTDTASVLLEAIGYIRFLQGQIEALSSPYLGTCSPNMRNNQQFLLNDNCLKRKGAPNQEYIEDKGKDLRSRGLCLVPVSCTQQVGSDNGADYWAPAAAAEALGGGF
ncbi:hypothetical protein ACOSQ3_020724 [Xanthoceras sorbifolium]